MKIRRVGAELFLVDGRTLDMTKLIVAFRNFAIALKMLDMCSEDGLQSQKCERNSVMFPILRRQATVYVCTKNCTTFFKWLFL